MTAPSDGMPPAGSLPDAETAALLGSLARIQRDEQDNLLTAHQANQAAADAVVQFMHRRRLMRSRPEPS